jgi:hypothetical protein
MKPWTSLVVTTVCAAAAASLGAALFGHEWSGGLVPGALAGVVVFLVRFLSGATPSKGPWAEAFLSLERRVSHLEARGRPEDGSIREPASRADVRESGSERGETFTARR